MYLGSSKNQNRGLLTVEKELTDRLDLAECGDFVFRNEQAFCVK